jgi:hypothetical protein
MFYLRTNPAGKKFNPCIVVVMAAGEMFGVSQSIITALSLG